MAKTEDLRVPPHSIEAEQAVIGGLLLEEKAWDEVADKLREEDFYAKEHKVIFHAIVSLAQENKPIDVITLTEKLKELPNLKDSDLLGYLATLAKDTPTAAHISAYAEIVREQSILRQLISVGTEITESSLKNEGKDSKTLLDIAEQKIFNIAEQDPRMRLGFSSIKNLLTDVMKRIETLSESDDPVTGVPTGFKEFDEKTSGLQKGDLIIVAGRPSMGKTSFAMNIAEYATFQRKSKVAVFSMEMPGNQLAMRMLSSMGRINQQNVRTGKLADEDWPRLTSALSLLSESKLFIDDDAYLTPSDIRARARRLKRTEHELDLIIVDYIQLMQSTGVAENRATELSNITRQLKALAKELDVPVIVLSQLNRSLEQRTDKRPIMSDLRDSGAIEQDADLIAFIYRDEVYNEDSPNKGTAEIIVAKQRNGPIFKTMLSFHGEHVRFDNYTPDIYTPEDVSI
jgi:replicative DNA helicase